MTEAAPPSDSQTPSTAVQYQPKTPAMRRYLWFYSLASMGVALFWGAVLVVLLPLQVQALEFARFFTGRDAGVDLQALTLLQNQVAAGTATATAEQQRLLGLLAQFNGTRATSLSLVTSAGIVLPMLLSPIIGILSDRTRSRWGRRAPWITAGGIGGAALICLLPTAPSIAVLVVLWSLTQVAVGLAQGPLTATVADRVPEKQFGVVSGINGLASYLGAIVGAIVTGALFAAMGLSAYFPIALVLAVCTLLFVLVAPDRSSNALSHAPLSLRKFILSYGVALRDPDYRWAWIAKVLLYLGYSISGVFSIYMLQSYITPALSAAQAAQTAPMLQFAALPGTLLSMFVVGSWSDRVGRRKPFVIAASVIMAIGLLVPFISATLPALFVQAIVTGIGYGMFVVVDQALFIDVLPDREAAGRDLGFSSLGQNLGQALGPIVAGLVVSMFGGHYGPVWPVAFVLVLVSVFAVMPIKRVK